MGKEYQHIGFLFCRNLAPHRQHDIRHDNERVITTCEGIPEIEWVVSSA